MYLWMSSNGRKGCQTFWGWSCGWTWCGKLNSICTWVDVAPCLFHPSDFSPPTFLFSFRQGLAYCSLALRTLCSLGWPSISHPPLPNFQVVGSQPGATTPRLFGGRDQAQGSPAAASICTIWTLGMLPTLSTLDTPAATRVTETLEPGIQVAWLHVLTERGRTAGHSASWFQPRYQLQIPRWEAIQSQIPGG